MILFFEKSEAFSRFHRGQATIMIYEGHGEYALQRAFNSLVGSFRHEGSDLQIEVFTMEDDDTGELKTILPDWLASHLEAAKSKGDNWYDQWGYTTRLHGSVYDLWRLFYAYANMIDPMCDPADYTPGGDDDTYDYYPSGFRALTEIAKDLDELDMHLRPENRRRFAARERVCEIVKHLMDVKPLEDWDDFIGFDEYIKPYLMNGE